MPSDSLVIDGGANVGKVTSAFVRYGFEVHAFEPDPVAFAILERKFGDRPDVHLHAAAVGAAAGKMRLYRTRRFARQPVRATVSSSLIPRATHDEDNSVEVEVVDLMAFIRQLGRRVDLLKLDIEGSEVALLERILDEGLYRDIGAIYVETHERHSPELAERTRRLRQRVKDENIETMCLDWR